MAPINPNIIGINFMSKIKVKYGKFKILYQGDIFSIKQRDVIYPDNTKEIHEYCARFDSATILAFDNKNRLLLTREFRPGSNKYKWFLPTGKIEKGESPRQAAQRELREETGFKAKTIRRLFKKPASSSYFLWNVYVFVAKDLILAPLKAEEKLPIEVKPTSLKKAAKMAIEGTIDNQFLAYFIIRVEYMMRKGLIKL